MKHLRNLSNKMVLRAIKKERGMDAWISAQMMYITKNKTPMDAFDIMLQMNEKNLYADLVKQERMKTNG